MKVVNSTDLNIYDNLNIGFDECNESFEQSKTNNEVNNESEIHQGLATVEQREVTPSTGSEFDGIEFWVQQGTLPQNLYEFLDEIGKIQSYYDENLDEDGITGRIIILQQFLAIAFLLFSSISLSTVLVDTASDPRVVQPNIPNKIELRTKGIFS